MGNGFSDKELTSDDESLKTSLGATYPFWHSLVDYVHSVYPKVIEEWHFSKNAGWIFRLKDKNRAIIYLLPNDHFFQVVLVFGQKATDEVLKSNVSNEIKTVLKAAKVYAEGRGIRIDVSEKIMISDIKELINIKLN